MMGKEMDQAQKEKAAQLLVGKIMLEPDYIDELVEDPKKALEAIGIEDPTEEMIEAVESLDMESIQGIARAFEPHRIGE